MSEQSGFFDAHLVGGDYDRVYLAQHFARYFASFIGNGVFAGTSESIKVSQSNPEGMQVVLSPGQAWINGYWYENSDQLTLAVEQADGVLGRIDSVVLRWSSLDRTISAVIKKGAPANNPVVPELQRDSDCYELQLAEIQIPAGTPNVLQVQIFDTRPDSELCGWVHGVVDQVDVSQLHSQYQASYEQELKRMQDYAENQRRAFEAFFTTLTEDLNITTFIQEYQNLVTLETPLTEIPLGVYEYSMEDTLFVTCDGSLLAHGRDYTVQGVGAQARVQFTSSRSAGERFEFRVLKSQIGSASSDAVLAAADDETVLTDEGAVLSLD